MVPAQVLSVCDGFPISPHRQSMCPFVYILLPGRCPALYQTVFQTLGIPASLTHDPGSTLASPVDKTLP